MSVAPLATQFHGPFHGVGYAGLSLFLSGLLWAHSLVQLPAGLILVKNRCLSRISPRHFHRNHRQYSAVSRTGQSGTGNRTAVHGRPEFRHTVSCRGQSNRNACPSGKNHTGTRNTRRLILSRNHASFQTLPYLGAEAWRFPILYPQSLP